MFLQTQKLKPLVTNIKWHNHVCVLAFSIALRELKETKEKIG